MVRENIENLNNKIEAEGNKLDINYVGETEKEVSKKIDKILEDLERSNKQLEEIFDKKKVKDDIENVISRSNEDIDKKWLTFKEVLNKIIKALEKESLGERLISKTRAGGEALSESYSSGEKDLERIRKILSEYNDLEDEKNVSEPKPELEPQPSQNTRPKPKAKAKKKTDKKPKVKKAPVVNNENVKNENIEKLREEFLDYARKIKSMSKTIRKNREKLGNEAVDIDLILEDVEELEKKINSGEERELNTLRNNIKAKFELVGKKSDIRSLAIDIANSELSVALKDEAKKIEKDSISVIDLYGLNKIKNELKKIKETAKNDNPSRGVEEKKEENDEKKDIKDKEDNEILDIKEIKEGGNNEEEEIGGGEKNEDEKNEGNSSLESRQEFFDGFYDDTEEKVYELKNVALRDDYLERLQGLKDKYDDLSEADVEDLWQLRTEIYDVYAAENKDFEKRKSVHEVLSEMGATASVEDLDGEKNYKGILENNKVELDEAVKKELGRLLMEYNIIDGEEGSEGKMEEIYENLKSGLDEALKGEVEREFSKLRHHKEKILAGVGVAGISALASAGMRLVGGGLVSGSLIAGGAALGAGSGLLRSKIRKFLSPKMQNIKEKEGERYKKIREEKAQEVLSEENIKLLLLQSLKSEIAKKAAGDFDCSVEDYRANVEEFFNANNSELAGSLSAKKREAVLDSLAVFSKITNENSGKLAGSIEPKTGKWSKINESAKSAAIGGVFGAVSGTARSISETAAAASLSSGLFGGVISGAMMSGKIEEMMKKHDIKKIQEEADSLVQKIKSDESGDYNFYGDLRKAQVLLESGVLDKNPLVREKLRNSLSERLADLIKLENKEIEVLDSKTGKDTMMEDLKKRIEKGNLRKWKAWAAGIGGGMVIGSGTALAFSISELGGEGNGNNLDGNNPPPPPSENFNPNVQFPDDIGGQVSALGLDDYIKGQGIEKADAFEKSLNKEEFKRLLAWRDALEEKASEVFSKEEIDAKIYELAKDGNFSFDEIDATKVEKLMGKEVAGEIVSPKPEILEEDIIKKQTEGLELAKDTLQKSIKPEVLDRIKELDISKNTLEIFAKDGSIDENDLKIYEEAPLKIKGNEKLFREFFDSVNGKGGVRLETIESGGSISQALNEAIAHDYKVTVVNPDGNVIKNFDANLVHEGDTIVDVDGEITVFKTSGVAVKKDQSLEGIYDSINKQFKLREIPGDIQEHFNLDKGEGGFHEKMNRTEAKNAREFWNGLGKERQEAWKHLSNDHKEEILKNREWVSYWKEQNPHLGNQEWLYIEDKNNLGLRASAIDSEGNDGVPDVVKIFSGDKTIETIERNQDENGEEFLIRTENSIKDTIKTKNNEINSIIDGYKIKPQAIKEAGINFFDKNFSEKMKIWGENQDGIFKSNRIVKSFFEAADRFDIDYNKTELIEFLNQNSIFKEDLLDIGYMEKAMQSFKYAEEHPNLGISAADMLNNFEQLSVFKKNPEQMAGMFGILRNKVSQENLSKLFSIEQSGNIKKRSDGVYVLEDAVIDSGSGVKADILFSTNNEGKMKFGIDGPSWFNVGTKGVWDNIKPDTDLISDGKEKITDLKKEFVEKMKALKESQAQEAANRQEGP